MIHYDTYIKRSRNIKAGNFTFTRKRLTRLDVGPVNPNVGR